MKVIAINGSPRKNWNTATLLEKALDGAKSVGADVEMIHLYDLSFKGCTSCFACKRKGSQLNGKCAMKDDLTEVLDKIHNSDILLLGSPIYLGNVTGEMRSFYERLAFAGLSYNVGHGSVFTGKVASGFIYTMNLPEDTSVLNLSEEYKRFYCYDDLFLYFQRSLEMLLHGSSEFLASYDTYQFADYSNYDVTMFDEKLKAKARSEQFPLDCQKAFDMGVRLAAR